MIDSASNRKKVQRWRFLKQLNKYSQTPMIVLAIIWLVLTLISIIYGLHPTLELISNVIWLLFVIDFFIEILIAPNRLKYLRHNWITAVSVILPAFRFLVFFRVFRLFRVAAAFRSFTLVRIIAVTRRALNSVSALLKKRGFGYVTAITTIVIFMSAGGIYYFERPSAVAQAGFPGKGISSFGDALWWSAMIITTMGSEYWPKTTEGRILCWLEAMYSFSILGYITATIASYFILPSEKNKQD